MFLIFSSKASQILYTNKPNPVKITFNAHCVNNLHCIWAYWNSLWYLWQYVVSPVFFLNCPCSHSMPTVSKASTPVHSLPAPEKLRLRCSACTFFALVWQMWCALEPTRCFTLHKSLIFGRSAHTAIAASCREAGRFVCCVTLPWEPGDMINWPATTNCDQIHQKTHHHVHTASCTHAQTPCYAEYTQQIQLRTH